MTLPIAAVSAVAQTQGLTNREAELLRRLETLERRIQELEKAPQAASAAPAATPATSPPSAPAPTIAAPPWAAAIQPPATIALPPAGALQPGPPVISVEEAQRQTARAVANERAKAAGKVPKVQQDADLQAAFIFRDSIPTLNKQQFEVSSELSYRAVTTALQTERSALTINALRLGLTDGVELNIRLPAYITERQTQIGPGALLGREVQGIGDVGVGLSAVVFKPTYLYPGIALSTGIGLPTGVSPYEFRNYAPGLDPRSVFEAIQSRGHYTAEGQLTIFKTFDPLVLFASLKTDYSFSREIDGYLVEPGWRYGGTIGFSFAVSEFTTLGFQLTGQFDQAIAVSGTVNDPRSPFFGTRFERNKVRGLTPEAWIARVAAVQRLDVGLYAEPFVAFGLTDTSPDLQVGVGMRKRF